MLSLQPEKLLPSIRRCLRQALHIQNYAFKFTGQAIRRALLELIEQCAIIPKSALSSAVKPLPERFPDLAIVQENGTAVVQFVGRRYEPDVIVRLRKPAQILFFSFSPGRLEIGVGIGATVDNVGHSFSKAPREVDKHRSTAAILHH